MPATRLLLAIDQGTTSCRAIAFGLDAQPVAVAQEEFTQHFPQAGWVEHDATEIWQTTLAVCRRVIADVEASGGQITAAGITNQRETTVIWDRASGAPIAPAIVWQDRRTAATCDDLKARGLEAKVTAKTGLLLDPYFSATKIAWLLDHCEGARQKADAGELCFGTTDSWLIYNLTKGAHHATDVTNASRTLLFDIHRQCWDEELAALFNVPTNLLGDVKDCAADFGEVDAEWFGKRFPIAGVAGDQQSALIGQACLDAGMIKSTYGTGCFMLMNTGGQPLASQNRLLTTVAYRLGGNVCYALEGAIFNAGTSVQWLRDELGLIGSASETESLAQSIDGNHGVYLVPAFTGLGAPWWRPDVRATLSGLTRDSGRAELVRAALESVCYQTNDLIGAMRADGAKGDATLRVDGGMVVNNWLLQFMADIVDCRIDRPQINETTALGAAFLAGLQSGVYDNIDVVRSTWRCRRQFEPRMSNQERAALLSGWNAAVKRTLLK